jgi:hypothetical protein
MCSLWYRHSLQMTILCTGQERTFLTGAQGSHLQRVTIPEAARKQLRRGPPDDGAWGGVVVKALLY